jgi:hypothetical protein
MQLRPQPLQFPPQPPQFLPQKLQLRPPPLPLLPLRPSLAPLAQKIMDAFFVIFLKTTPRTNWLPFPREGFFQHCLCCAHFSPPI